jgi:hypothetical protein
MIKNSSILKAKTNFLLPFLFSSLCFPFILFVRIISFFEKKKGGRERERDRKNSQASWRCWKEEKDHLGVILL